MEASWINDSPRGGPGNGDSLPSRLIFFLTVGRPLARQGKLAFWLPDTDQFAAALMTNVIRTRKNPPRKTERIQSVTKKLFRIRGLGRGQFFQPSGQPRHFARARILVHDALGDGPHQLRLSLH